MRDDGKDGITIRRAQNGFVVEHFEEYEDGGGRTVTEVFTDKEEGMGDSGEATALRSALYSVMENLGYCGSRYDENRVYIILAPGDKSEKMTDAQSEAIWGKFEETEKAE